MWVRLHGALVRAADGTSLHFVVQVEDISAFRAQQSELERLGMTDPLTGLANRAYVMQHLRHALTRRTRSGEQVAMLLLDLNHFKTVNDTLGHLAGDALLCAVGARLTAVAHAHDTVGRFGGDEFVVLLEDLTRGSEAEEVARRMVHALGAADRPRGVRRGERRDQRRRRRGLARDPATGGPVPAGGPRLYRAKEDGRGRVAVYAAELQRTARQRQRQRQHIYTVLRRALAEDGVRTWFQPAVDLGTGEVVALEALVRLAGERLPAPDLVPAGEDLGLVAELDTAVLREVQAWTSTPPVQWHGLREVHVNVGSARSSMAPRHNRLIPGHMSERQAVRSSRAPAVLAPMAGILAMHGLATRHHGMTGSPLLTAVVVPVGR